MKPEERATRRAFLRLARVLIGFVILVALAGGALWLRAAFYPWTDGTLPDARSPHAVLHLRNEAGAPFTLAWRRAGGEGRQVGPWIDLPAIPKLPDGVAEQRGFRLIAPLPPALAANRADAPIELRLVIGSEERIIALELSATQHVRLRIDPALGLHLQSGRANWLGAPDFPEAEVELDAATGAPR